MLGAPADLLSLVYVLAALYTLWQLPRQWRSLTDAEYTADDRSLAGRIGFLLLTPLGVLIHEAAHMLLAWLYGAQGITLSFRVYWGYVSYYGRLPATAEWAIASAGPLASLLLGLAVGYLALGQRPAWRDAGLSFAHATLVLDLLLYPGMSVVDQIGDFRWIYSRQTPALSIVAGVVHVLGLLAWIILARKQSAMSRAEARGALSAQFAGQQITLREEIVVLLANLEAAEKVRRLEPNERAQLNELRELRAWSEEHNRAVAASPAPPSPEDEGSRTSRPPETPPHREDGLA